MSDLGCELWHNSVAAILTFWGWMQKKTISVHWSLKNNLYSHFNQHLLQYLCFFSLLQTQMCEQSGCVIWVQRWRKESCHCHCVETQVNKAVLFNSFISCFWFCNSCCWLAILCLFSFLFDKWRALFMKFIFMHTNKDFDMSLKESDENVYFINQFYNLCFQMLLLISYHSHSYLKYVVYISKQRVASVNKSHVCQNSWCLMHISFINEWYVTIWDHIIFVDFVLRQFNWKCLKNILFPYLILSHRAVKIHS